MSWKRFNIVQAVEYCASGLISCMRWNIVQTMNTTQLAHVNKYLWKSADHVERPISIKKASELEILLKVLCAAVCRSLPLCTAMYRCVPLCAADVCCRAPLCAAVYRCAPVFATVCRCVLLCAAVCRYLPLSCIQAGNMHNAQIFYTLQQMKPKTLRRSLQNCQCHKLALE